MKVVEMFTSINGEGPLAGELAFFVRFKGCNLHCSYCDTWWANEKECGYEELSVAQIVSRIKDSQITNVTLTGGEPLLQKDILLLIEALQEYHVEIETNGSIDISSLQIEHRPSFTLDYKTPSSLMNQEMNLHNYELLKKEDTVKFVCGSWEDLECARNIIETYQLTKRCHVYLSAVFGKITPSEIVDYMKRHQMNQVRLQLQLHKYIWNPEARGV